MAIENRFVLDTMLAEEQGICKYFGEECCTVISMYTEQEGNLTMLLESLKTMREKQVRNSNWNTKLTSIEEWFQNMSWTKIFQTIGMATDALILVAHGDHVLCISPHQDYGRKND